MWLIASVAIICTICVISLMIGYALMHWRRHKAELLLQENLKYKHKYILTPSSYHKREPSSGIPYTANEPVNIQPHFKTLQSMDVSMLSDENLNNNNSRMPTTPEYQIPLISYYESEKNASGNRRKSRKRRTIKESYGPKSSNVVKTPTIVISQVADNNANFAKIESNAKPELTFSIFYDELSKDLHITVIKASNLPGLKQFADGAQYFRVRVHVGACGKQYHETRYECGTRAPVFGETFIVSGLVHHKLRECTVRFAVIEFEELQHCWTVVGEVSQPLIDLRANRLLKVTQTLHKI